jgi:hypothetical protein
MEQTDFSRQPPQCIVFSNHGIKEIIISDLKEI